MFLSDPKRFLLISFSSQRKFPFTFHPSTEFTKSKQMQTLQNRRCLRERKRSDKNPSLPPSSRTCYVSHPLGKRLKKHLILFLDSSGRKRETLEQWIWSSASAIRNFKGNRDDAQTSLTEIFSHRQSPHFTAALLRKPLRSQLISMNKE